MEVTINVATVQNVQGAVVVKILEQVWAWLLQEVSDDSDVAWVSEAMPLGFTALSRVRKLNACAVDADVLLV